MLEAEAKLEAHGLLSLIGHGEEVQPALHQGQVSTCLHCFPVSNLKLKKLIRPEKQSVWPMIQWHQWRSDSIMANEDKVGCHEMESWSEQVYGCGE